MIHRVEVTTELGQGMTVAHHFESMTDDEESAEQFGKESWEFSMAWMRGWVSADDAA